MMFDRSLRASKNLGNVAVRRAVCDQCQNVLFALCESERMMFCSAVVATTRTRHLLREAEASRDLSGFGRSSPGLYRVKKLDRTRDYGRGRLLASLHQTKCRGIRRTKGLPGAGRSFVIALDFRSARCR